MGTKEFVLIGFGATFVLVTILSWWLDDMRRAKVRLLSSRGAPLVDVGLASDYERSHMEGAANIPLEELETRIGDTASLGQTVLVCGHGFVRRARGARLLRAMGYVVTNAGFTRASMTERPTR
jgi:rhodanese-related sulfurtransferase